VAEGKVKFGVAIAFLAGFSSMALAARGAEWLTATGELPSSGAVVIGQGLKVVSDPFKTGDLVDSLSLDDGTPLRDAIAELKRLRAEKKAREDALAARKVYGFGCGPFGTELCYQSTDCGALLPSRTLVEPVPEPGAVSDQVMGRAICEDFGLRCGRSGRR
jgi:hypothetical protein